MIGTIEVSPVQPRVSDQVKRERDRATITAGRAGRTAARPVAIAITEFAGVVSRKPAAWLS
jgi:hypothetical protein